MAGGLWCNPQKDDICMLRADSGGIFATIPHLQGCSKHRFPPFSDNISPLIIRVQKNVNFQNFVKSNVVLHLIIIFESF
jgi:hypothetical protein